MKLWKAIRRWWMRVTHRHEWEVVCRFPMTYRIVVRNEWTQGIVRDDTVKCRAILERCTCSQERARFWHNDEWYPLDLDDLNDQWARNGFVPPCRTYQE